MVRLSVQMSWARQSGSLFPSARSELVLLSWSLWRCKQVCPKLVDPATWLGGSDVFAGSYLSSSKESSSLFEVVYQSSRKEEAKGARSAACWTWLRIARGLSRRHPLARTGGRIERQERRDLVRRWPRTHDAGGPTRRLRLPSGVCSNSTRDP